MTAADLPSSRTRSVTATHVAMDTLVSFEVVGVAAAAEHAVRAAITRAFGWFGAVEQACSRFDAGSELRQLLGRADQPVPVCPVLFEALRLALALAERTGGAFDPTVGAALEARGFNRHYVTGERVRTLPSTAAAASYRDVRLDASRRTVSLARPLVLDLGAVAKGLALDLAARELAPYHRFCVDAGGDLYAAGTNAQGRPWRVGVQHPRDPGALAYELDVADRAVCTSGDYERRAPGGDHHLLDPRTGRSARALASVTVVGPTAMAADGLATAAFVLGPDRGLKLLQEEDVSGVLVTSSGEVLTTGALRSRRPPTSRRPAQRPHRARNLIS